MIANNLRNNLQSLVFLPFRPLSRNRDWNPSIQFDFGVDHCCWVVVQRNGFSTKWSFDEMDFRRSDSSTKWHSTKWIFGEVTFSTKWSFDEMAFDQMDFRRSDLFDEVAVRRIGIRRNGFSTKWLSTKWLSTRFYDSIGHRSQGADLEQKVSKSSLDPMVFEHRKCLEMLERSLDFPWDLQN